MANLPNNRRIKQGQVRGIDVEIRSTNTISFDLQANYGTRSAPRSGTLTQNLTGARVGVIAKIFYNDANLPTLTGWHYGTTATNFVPFELNIIWLEFEGNGNMTARVEKG